MSLGIHVSAENVRLSLSRTRVEEIARRVLRAEKVRDAMLSITFVDRQAIAQLNQRHLGHRGPTDVISFGFDRAGAGGPVVGDVYIAPEVARENATAHGERVRTELARLVVHGVLHVLGHDHPDSDDRMGSPMWKRQESLLRALDRAGVVS